MMKRLLLTIQYDGTAYHGWQVQANALSVQEAFQDAVEKVFGERLNVKGCSRTDSGVHANKYCLTLDTSMNITDEGVVMALNAQLPPDIAVKACREVSFDFHPRYSCTRKQYVYRIYNGGTRNPFVRNTAYYYRYPIEVELLNNAAKAFCGTHDFAGFCSVRSDVENTVRTVVRAEVKRDGDFVLFTFEADGFLYNMVRIMVGTLLFVNEGKIAPDALPDVIASKDRSRAGRTAQPQGLFLNDIFYDE